MQSRSKKKRVEEVQTRDLKRSRKRKGGELAVHVNNRWCHPGHVTVTCHLCSPDIELFGSKFSSILFNQRVHQFSPWEELGVAENVSHPLLRLHFGKQYNDD
ncbi:hypothetical protein AMECASPLE_035711 [Ameca splendens]|uniref:Uncharacterized protein n=1 Tax=Ameca splendens TaxID=208324 RepID=A0ABV0YVT6_9TELE